MEKQIVIELRCIANRLQWLTSVLEIYTLKTFSKDKVVLETLRALRDKLGDAEGNL